MNGPLTWALGSCMEYSNASYFTQPVPTVGASETEVFNRILLHHSGDAYEKFEEISALVKKTDLKFKDPKFDFEVNAEYGAKQITPEEAWVARSKNLLNEVSEPLIDEDKIRG